MIGFLPLVRDFVTKLQTSSEFQAAVDIGTRVFTERPPNDSALPFAVIDMISANAWNHQTQRGTSYLMQVSIFVGRQDQGTQRGMLDVGQAAEIVRDMFDDLDGYDLLESPSEGATLGMDFEAGRYLTRSENGARLILRQYEAATIVPDPSGRYLAATCRFRCVVGNVGD